MARVLCFALVTAFLPTLAFAQRDALSELYGEGVHRYFAGDYSTADQLLSRVVDSGSKDPRAHYFRGLVRDAMGGGGDLDYETGAQLEATGPRAVDVGAALIRIQGYTREKIEKARRDARAAVQQQQLMMEQARQYSEDAEAAAGRDALPGDVPPADATDPFSGDDPAPVPPAMEPEPAVPEVDDAVNPFGDDPAPTPDMTQPAPADDIFGGDAPAAEPAPPAADATNPFGSDPAPAEANPFGSDPAPAEANPFGSDPAPADGNPFDMPGGNPFGL